MHSIRQKVNQKTGQRSLQHITYDRKDMKNI